MVGALAKQVGALLKTSVMAATPLSGGDLSDIQLLELSDGRRVVAKTGPAPEAEAEMLRVLTAAGVPAPMVLAADKNVLVIRYVESHGSLKAAEADLGAVLRRMHAAHGPHYGWNCDYAFGAVKIENAPAESWPVFWGERRLLSSVPFVPVPIARALEKLNAKLPDLLLARPPASLLHGDLWGGNVMAAGGRIAALIDPACYYGDGEVDLAMLNLFGSTGADFQATYGPLAPGWQERRAVYTLWPALVHLRLFGSGYRGLVERLLGKFL